MNPTLKSRDASEIAKTIELKVAVGLGRRYGAQSRKRRQPLAARLHFGKQD